MARAGEPVAMKLRNWIVAGALAYGAYSAWRGMTKDERMRVRTAGKVT